MASNKHVVLKHDQYSTYTVVSELSSTYIDLVRSGYYTEVAAGTKRQCEDWVEDNVTVPEQ